MPTTPHSALRAEVARTTALLRSIRNPQAPALGEWTVAELAAHLTHAWTALPALARRPAPSLLPSGRAGTGLIARLEDLAGLTRQLVAADHERDPRVLADRLDAAAAAFLTEPADDTPCPWMIDGVTVDRRHIACHLLNETVLHAFDLARADGHRWRVDPGAAALILEGFILPVMRLVDPRSLVRQDRAAGLHATYDGHVRGGLRFRLVLDDGRLLAPEHPKGRADCHLGAEPTALLLVLWGRISPWPAILTGRFVAWGRRPWLARMLPAVLRNP